MRGVLIGFLLVMGGICGQAQEQFQHSIRNYKAIDGLPQSQVKVMLEDNNGYLWIGTEGGGLARFDGRSFKVYTTLDGLQSNIVQFLKLDSKQNLWVVHPRGISKFDGKGFKKFEQARSQLNARRLRRAFELNDTIFFTSAPGHLGKIYNDSVYYWGKPIRKMNKDHLVSFVHKTPDGSILLCINDSSFYFRGKKDSFWLSHKGVFNRLYNIFNYKGQIWAKTDKGFFTVELNDRKFTHADLPVSNHIISYDSVNEVFWTRQGGSIMKERIDGKTVKTETVLTDVEVTQVLIDFEGNTWFGTNGMGLFKYYIQDFDRCSSENMRNVMAIHIDREGASWVGSSTKGLWRLKQNKITSFYDSREPYRNTVNYIAESPDGEIWIGTAAGLGKFNPVQDKFQYLTREDGLSGGDITNIQFEDRGVWIATYGGGVNHYDGKKFTYYTTKNGLSSNTIVSIHYSNYYDRLFVGDEFGLSSISKGEVTPLTIAGIENTSIVSLESYRDSLLLIGTGGAGFVIYNPASRQKKFFTTKEGLPSDFIYFVAPDGDYFWVGTEKGITRLKLNAFLDVEENLHFDYENGLVGVETNQNAFYINGDKKYFGLIDGLYQFNDLKYNKGSFPLHLTDVQLLYGEYKLKDFATRSFGFFDIPLNPVLPPDKNHITFHFNRVDKRYPKSVKFKYFLENFDKTWSPPSSSNEVTYSNLPPGQYTFRVMSTNHAGSWDPPAVAYSFVVNEPFYQTSAFVLTSIVLSVGIVILLLYMRVKRRVSHMMLLERIRVQEQETLRKEIARDFHDEMGNQLTRIINYVSLLKLNGTAKRNGNHYTQLELYTKVEDSAKYLYTGTRDFIWSIDPGNDEMNKLFIHIRDFGEKLFEEKDISFRAFNEIKENIKLPYGFCREANLIFKEAMTNAFKYSEAKNVTLTLKREGEKDFVMSFEDDGVGFYTGDIRNFNGLQNIRDRADKIGGVLRIQSSKQSGTKIILHFKLTNNHKYGLAV